MTTGTIAAELDTLAAPLSVEAEMVQNAGLQTLYYVAYQNTPSFEFADGLRGFRLNAPTDQKLRLLIDGLPVEEAYPEGRGHEVSWASGRHFIERGAETIWFKDGSYFTSAPWRVGGAAGGAASRRRHPRPHARQGHRGRSRGG